MTETSPSTNAIALVEDRSLPVREDPADHSTRELVTTRPTPLLSERDIDTIAELMLEKFKDKSSSDRGD